MSCLTPSLSSPMLMEQFLDIEEELVNPTNLQYLRESNQKKKKNKVLNK